ncbi:hypothetical protein L861_09005 [Litchfieldella anticariensis FP35 = DSM 16096]|uniref:Uncharacterized protein n=1 Tax=Litchfieldella anticariensis (strain DSM 16096 / CECT 5854 / CIP 108499 / LMG 22089 / FP35) TaxID=1121939 RepID=S2KPT8_LITA3|nr:hypothetical protein [Halomonas anticariensis]EPC02483.1 hypothetical protein L861_09005 [Halomonas anticariensis FP35 = DSM 16096]
MPEEIIVKNFSSYEEIAALDGFEEEKGVSTDNYADIAGHYHLSDSLRCCRVLESGGLCHQKHNYGFVVALKSGGFSILGNRCALSKFAKDSKVRIAADRYEKERKRQEAIDGLRKIFSEKKERIETLSISLNYVYELYKYMRNIKDSLPMLCKFSLEDMARSGKRNVAVSLVYRHYYIDKESGEKKHEDTDGVHTVGTISAISLFNKNSFEEPLKNLRESLKLLENFHRVDEKATELQAKRFAAGIMGSEQAIRIKQDFEKLYLELNKVKPGVISALCKELDDRVATSKIFLQAKGMPHSNSKARQEITNLQEEIVEQTGAYKVIYG